MFTGTILENLLLVLEGEVDEHLILKVCEQRLAIARALLSNQPILIFDEATSGLDRKTESRVMANLSELTRTMIFIAHRSSVYQHVSRVVTMANGKLEAASPNFNPFQFI